MHEVVAEVAAFNEGALQITLLAVERAQEVFTTCRRRTVNFDDRASRLPGFQRP
jgi:hypothetical protein